MQIQLRLQPQELLLLLLLSEEQKLLSRLLQLLLLQQLRVNFRCTCYGNTIFSKMPIELTCFHSFTKCKMEGFLIHAFTPFHKTASSCGGYLSDSGSIYSPGFPYYYPDNSYCVWYLSVPSGQRVILTFHEINLETCCNCDYIAVHDGYSTSSPLLGRVCQNSEMRNFHSSSRYMTIVFRSDYSIAATGFYATFTTSLSESSGNKDYSFLDCSSDNMNIVISSSFLNSVGYSGYDLYLNDQRCRPQVSSYQVVFNFPLNTCGTLREVGNGRVVYSNDVRAYYSSGGEITRQSNFQLHVGCYMDQDATAQIMYQAKEDINSTITGTGRFNATMNFYTSSSFITPVYSSPYIVTLNQDLYVQVKLLRNDSSLVLSVDTCVASPSPHDFSTRSYDLIRNGCVIDRTYYSFTYGNRNVAQFKFRAFKFLRSHPMVYLQCKVNVCKAHESNSVCTQPCRSRKTRSLKSTYEDATLVLGPIQLKGEAPTSINLLPDAFASGWQSRRVQSEVNMSKPVLLLVLQSKQFRVSTLLKDTTARDETSTCGSKGSSSNYYIFQQSHL
uniref:CUB and zona pellucida-like domains 1, tandem duplicate 1 n=1 Tax=Scleropages formosus TaxID=113540 RepID=A0A8C9RJI7_SCLFO